MNRYKIKGFRKALFSINQERAMRGESLISSRNWASFLSRDSPGNKVKQYWITQVKGGEGIPREKTLLLLSALNTVLTKYNIETFEENSVINSEDGDNNTGPRRIK